MINEINEKKHTAEEQLSEYLKGFKSVCWYPSAGRDYREIMYLSKKFADLKNWDEEQFPDCFVLTDYASYGVADILGEGKYSNVRGLSPDEISLFPNHSHL